MSKIKYLQIDFHFGAKMMSSNRDSALNDSNKNETPSKLKPPRTVAHPSTAINSSCNSAANTSQPNSSTQISPGGRTLRKRRIDSGDEDVLQTKNSNQTAKKVILQSNLASNTIKSNVSARTTSSLSNSRTSKQLQSVNSTNSQNKPAVFASKRPGWDTKVNFCGFIFRED